MERELQALGEALANDPAVSDETRAAARAVVAAAETYFEDARATVGG